MNINTEKEFAGFAKDHHLSERWDVLVYHDGTTSFLPKGFFKTWNGKYPDFGEFTIGRCSGLGLGSTVKYDSADQSLTIGRYVSGGENIRFILNGQHNIDTITSYSLPLIGLPSKGVQNLGNTVLKNDIWIGDEAMIMGGSTVENGCVIGARSVIAQRKKLEPYGIYAGNPATLIRLRFDEKIIALLLDLAWWEKPTAWIGKHVESFHADLTGDVGRAVDILQRLKEDAA